jgi:hypothetical protein
MGTGIQFHMRRGYRLLVMKQDYNSINNRNKVLYTSGIESFITGGRKTIMWDTGLQFHGNRNTAPYETGI